MSDSKQYPTKLVRTLRGHSNLVTAVRFTDDGSYCMSCSKDRSICLWNPFKDTKDGFLIKRYKGPHNNSVNDVAIAKDNKTFVSGGEERDVFYWDITDGRILRKFYGHSQRINSVAFNEEGSLFASASSDTTVKLWDVRSHNSQCVQTLNDAHDDISSVCIYDTNIITGSIDGCIRTYDIRAGELHSDSVNVPVCSVNVSRDGQCIVASTTSSVILVIERSSGVLLNEFKDHRCEQYKIESIFNNTDEYVISGSEDGKVYIYDLVSTKVVNTLDYHRAPVCTVVQNKEDNVLLVGSFDGTVSVWR